MEKDQTKLADQTYFPIRVRYDCDNKDTIVKRPEDLMCGLGYKVIETMVKPKSDDKD